MITDHLLLAILLKRLGGTVTIGADEIYSVRAGSEFEVIQLPGARAVEVRLVEPAIEGEVIQPTRMAISQDARTRAQVACAILIDGRYPRDPRTGQPLTDG